MVNFFLKLEKMVRERERRRERDKKGREREKKCRDER